MRNILADFIRRRNLRSLQPVASSDHGTGWVKDVLPRIDFLALDKPPEPEPEKDFWLVDNAARVADKEGEIPNGR